MLSIHLQMILALRHSLARKSRHMLVYPISDLRSTDYSTVYLQLLTLVINLARAQ